MPPHPSRREGRRNKDGTAGASTAAAAAGRGGATGGPGPGHGPGGGRRGPYVYRGEFRRDSACGRGKGAELVWDWDRVLTDRDGPTPPPFSYSRAVEGLMYAFGDVQRPDPGSVAVLEDMTVAFLVDVCRRARPVPHLMPIPSNPARVQAVATAAAQQQELDREQQLLDEAVMRAAGGSSGRAAATRAAVAARRHPRRGGGGGAGASASSSTAGPKNSGSDTIDSMLSTSSDNLGLTGADAVGDGANGSIKAPTLAAVDAAAPPWDAPREMLLRSGVHPFVARTRMTVEDVKFACRKDAKMTSRIEELIYLDKVISSVRRGFDVPDEGAIADTAAADGSSSLAAVAVAVPQAGTSVAAAGGNEASAGGAAARAARTGPGRSA